MHFSTVIKDPNSKKLTNLWDETLSVLKSHHKTWDDVEYVTGVYPQHDKPKDIVIEIDKEIFKELAKKFNYDNGYGETEVPMCIEIVGTDWWLERTEYDGCESWQYKSKKEKPLIKKDIKSFGELRSYWWNI